MEQRRDARGERGTAAIELVLSLLWIVFAMLFFIGMGHLLMNKQHGLVAARFAAYYESGRERRPQAPQARAAVNSSGVWSLTRGAVDDAGEARTGDGSVGADVLSAFNSLLSFIGGDGELTYTARTTPTRGLLPQMWGGLRVSEHYTLAQDTWTCEKSGSYLDLLGGRIRLSSLIPFDLSCCETYPRR